MQSWHIPVWFLSPWIGGILYLTSQQNTDKSPRVEKKAIDHALSPQKHKNPRVRRVFSLTSLPSRLTEIQDTLESLVQQSIQPDAIYLCLPEYSVREKRPYRIPAALQTYLQKHPVIQVIPCEDLGPATKLLPVLTIEKDPETRLFPVDDDCLFPPQYFEELLAASLKYPHTVFGYHGLKVNSLGQYQFINQYAGFVDVVETVTGAVYKRDMLDPEGFHWVTRECPCFFTDDLVLNAHVAERGHPRVLLMSDPDHGITRGRQGMPHQMKASGLAHGLFRINFGDQGNNALCLRQYLGKTLVAHDSRRLFESLC